MSRLFVGMRRPRQGAARGSGVEPTEEKLGLLKASDLFCDLSEEQMLRVEKMTVMTRCERGRTVYTPGGTGEALFLLKRGKIHIYRLAPDGKKLVISVVEQDTLFGDMPYTGHRMLDSFAEAAEDSLLCVMSRRDIEDLIAEYPPIGVRLLGRLSQRVRELEARLEESSLHDISSRVAAALVRAAEGHGTPVSITHQELADMIGTHRETITRTLGELQGRGLLTLQRGRIGVDDLDSLRELASGVEPGRRDGRILETQRQ